MPEKNVVVMKLGGTSVATIERIKKAAEYIESREKANERPFIIISARGDRTDELIQLAKTLSNSPDPRELDQLMATGEGESAALLGIALKARGINAKSMNAYQLGFEACGDYGNAKIKQVADPDILRKALAESVIVFTGFQGVINGTSDIATLGRGGSDASAIALAATLGCECRIFTDVDGIYTTDPRVVKQSKRIATIGYDQLEYMADSGAAVMMGRSINIARKYGIQVRVMLSPSFGESKGGTLIASNCDLNDIEAEAEFPYTLAIKKMGCLHFPFVPNLPGQAKSLFFSLSDCLVDEAV